MSVLERLLSGGGGDSADDADVAGGPAGELRINLDSDDAVSALEDPLLRARVEQRRREAKVFHVTAPDKIEIAKQLSEIAIQLEEARRAVRAAASETAAGRLAQSVKSTDSAEKTLQKLEALFAKARRNVLASFESA